MKEVNFIADKNSNISRKRQNPNDLEKRDSHLARRMAKAKLTGKDISRFKFLHFESFWDMEFIQSFLKLWSRAGYYGPKEMQNLDFVFTWRKRDAIMQHKSAIEENVKIVTLVDMDHDLKDKDFRNINGIYSTMYACTLTTIQFLKDRKKLDKNILLHVVKEITNFDEEKCTIVINRALELTQERLERGSRYALEKFKKAKILDPLNDHDLEKAIEKELDLSKISYTKGSVQNKIKLHAKNDQNENLRMLLSKMMNDFSTVSV
jgi:hypothetical protein